MNLFEVVILNIIYIVFPLTMYLFYLAYKKNTYQEENNLFLDLALISSMYLCLKYTDNNYFRTSILIMNIPIILSYIKKRSLSAIIMSIIAIGYFSIKLKGNIILAILEYSIYFIIYLFSNNKYRNNYFIATEILVLKTTFFIIFICTNNYLFSQFFNSINDILTTLIIFYGLTFFAIIMFEKFEIILKYHMSYKELEQEKQIRTSLFRITHEIKNPIAVCKGYLDMYNEDNIDEYKKYLPIMKDEINHTLILLQDFLCMTKIKIEKEEMDINMLVEDVVANFKELIKQKNIDAKIDILEDEVYMIGDYNRLTQVVINLIKNGIEAIDENKEINKLEIKTCIDKGMFKLIIKDNGVGISNEVLKHIKEPFYTTKQNGTGLGVSLSYEIVQAHNGNLLYETEEYKGTTVNLLLPINS